MNYESRIKEVQITGRVIRGENLGKKLGFPTANLDRREYIRKRLKIKFGVWAGYAQILPPRRKAAPPSLVRKGRSEGWGGLWKAGIVIGPLDKNHLPKIEAYLIGFKGSLYGKKLMLDLKKYLRSFKVFKNQQVLKEQIKKDIKKINQLLA